MSTRTFFASWEREVIETFLDKGHVLGAVEDHAALNEIRDLVVRATVDYLGVVSPIYQSEFLNSIHEKIESNRLNDLRLHVINELSSHDWVRPTYFSLARRFVETIAGNQLAMQRRINLNIQMPNDPSSVLAVHGDVWTGDSAYEIVVWIPLVSCFGTKSMYLIPSVKRDYEIQARLSGFSDSEEIFRAIEPHVEFIDIKYGEVLIFCQNLMHGNRLNMEASTRWSLNCRFKDIFTPYADKKLGEFFEPITLRPATRMGAAYTLPGGFNE